MAHSPLVLDLFREPTETEARLIKAGVVPASWKLREARNWLFRHGLQIKHMAKEGTVRAERLLKAYAAWGDVLDPAETPSNYKPVAFIPNGGKTMMRGRPFKKPKNPALGMPAELTDDELNRRAVNKLREITQAFSEAPVTARDMDAMSVAPSPFKYTQRLYPCGRMWRKCPKAPDARELPNPSFSFDARPVIRPSFLRSVRGRVLQWVACNPHATTTEIGKAMELSTFDVTDALYHLYARGLVKRLQVYVISPTLVGEDRLFTYKDNRKKNPGESTMTAQFASDHGDTTPGTQPPGVD